MISEAENLPEIVLLQEGNSTKNVLVPKNETQIPSLSLPSNPEHLEHHVTQHLIQDAQDLKKKHSKILQMAKNLKRRQPILKGLAKSMMDNNNQIRLADGSLQTGAIVGVDSPQTLIIKELREKFMQTHNPEDLKKIKQEVYEEIANKINHEMHRVHQLNIESKG